MRNTFNSRGRVNITPVVTALPQSTTGAKLGTAIGQGVRAWKTMSPDLRWRLFGDKDGLREAQKAGILDENGDYIVDNAMAETRGARKWNAVPNVSIEGGRDMASDSPTKVYLDSGEPYFFEQMANELEEADTSNEEAYKEWKRMQSDREAADVYAELGEGDWPEYSKNPDDWSAVDPTARPTSSDEKNAVQQNLVDMGYLSEADARGGWGPKTEAAWKAYQEDLARDLPEEDIPEIETI